jgi:hypothetical protein
VALRYSVNVLGKIASGVGPLVDPLGIDVALGSPLLQPEVVAKAFGLDSVEAAARLLGVDAVLSQPIVVAEPAAPLVSLEAVLGDTAGVQALSAVRQRAIDNATVTIRGGGE